VTVSATQIKAAEAKGLINVDGLAAACDATGFPFYLACVICDKETDGRNIFGHDKRKLADGTYTTDGVAFSGPPTVNIEVTEERYTEFLKLIASGQKSNGCGPLQLTYRGYHIGPESLTSQGLKAWVPADNMLYGVRLLANTYTAARKQGLSVEKAFWNTAKIYNGGSLSGEAGATYADHAVSLMPVWKAAIGTTDTEEDMGHAVHYPGADRTSQWRGSGGATMPSVNKLLLHTTETAGWPGYPGFQPTLTFNPWQPRGKRWRQHLPINGSASTLQNAGTFRTNRANVCQIEIVAYCDPARRSSSAHISKISADAYHELGEFWAWIHREWGVPLKLYPNWKAYPASYGTSNGIRMSVAQFGAFKGVCGHQHAPGNDHGDPGDLRVAQILSAATEIQEDDMPTAKEIVDEMVNQGPAIGKAIAKGFLSVDNVIVAGKDEPNEANTHQVPATFITGDHDLLVDIRDALEKLATKPTS
jgi:hypothetical protein